MTFATFIRSMFRGGTRGTNNAVHRDAGVVSSTSSSANNNQRLDTMELYREEAAERAKEREEAKVLYKQQIALSKKKGTAKSKKNKRHPKTRNNTLKQNKQLMNEPSDRPSTAGSNGSWPRVGQALRIGGGAKRVASGALNGGLQKFDSMVRSLLDISSSEDLEAQAAAANAAAAAGVDTKNGTLRKGKRRGRKKKHRRKKKENGTMQEEDVDPKHDKKLPWWTKQVESFLKKHDPSRVGEAPSLVSEHKTNLPKLMYRLHREYKVPQDRFFVRGAHGLSVRGDELGIPDDKLETRATTFSMGSISV